MAESKTTTAKKTTTANATKPAKKAPVKKATSKSYRSKIYMVNPYTNVVFNPVKPVMDIEVDSWTEAQMDAGLIVEE